ncbi:hypothetical protein [Malacoplasma penetrans HF-2]|uniref:Lipoprotein-associated type-17 domain-containing protein n=1 Tax=Malacoplasma penetrans (strain HF-2) TaxID=272633 RepID=Q8EWE4_MALP2|nr:lipoprotein 17-related variable surface protein [Malacoplasma penetrans]BAC44052.1 hypothetical protein [Malacoplasma penetrans HF-2]
MNNTSKKISLAITSSILSVATGLSIAIPIAGNTAKDTSIANVSSVNQATESSPIIASEVNDQNANLSTSNGPITFLGDKITALDWFGNKLWEIDFSKLVEGSNGQIGGGSSNFTGAWKRTWWNWDYNRATDTIWVIGYWSNTTKKQPLFEIKASNGEILNKHEIDYSKFGSDFPNPNIGTVYRFITSLSSGKVMIYGGAGNSYDAKGVLYDPKNKTATLIKGDSASTEILPMNNTSYGTKYKWYFFNLIPIATNRNIVEVVNFVDEGSITGDNGAGKANYNIYFLLVDDNLNMIHKKDSSSPWAKHVQVASGMQGFRNSKITPQRDYYSLLDGKVVTVVYNTAIIIDGKSNDTKIGTFPMTDSKWIKSWAFDSNQNLYFKFKGEKIVYKVSGSAWDNLGSNLGNKTISPDRYLDLGGVTAIKDYADNMTIYNVYGFTGQLMMINSKYNENVDTNNSSLSETNTGNYGLAIAVNQNSTNQNVGDYKGILNGPDSIQKASDFNLSDSARTSKIPSEITKDDIVTTNGFLKNSTDFKIVSMDDTKGSIEIETNLYQIPWFATRLPDNISPKTVRKTYTTDNKIQNKTSWKTLSNTTDYDFVNMKPTTIQREDVENLDPFQVSFQSQIITNANGAQLYPKKTYSVSEQNDSAGTVKVTVKYEYIPMGITYTGNNSSQIKSYETNTTYNVFNSTTTTPAFHFAGQRTSEASVDIRQVSELKNLLSANTLPSSFSNLNTSTDKTNSGFLQFINTNTSKGYPISKMTFKVTANDSAGTLKIEATMPSSNSPTGNQQSFNVTYTNLNKSTNYKFGFKTVNTIGGQNIKSILPSAVTDGDIINNFIEYTGFSSNDFSIAKTIDDEKGTLTVAINLDKDYAQAIGNGSLGFKNYSATRVFSGFMTRDEYNQRFDVQFVKDSSSQLLQLKQLQVSEIFSSLTGTSPKGLTVENTNYKNLNDLIDKLLIESRGSSIPTANSWSNNTKISSSMNYDNAQGTISFYIKIDKSLVDGSNSDLNLVVNYTGFVKGNVDTTNDNLSFVADNMLESYLISSKDTTEEQFKTFNPTTFAEWLKANDNEKALKLISYKSGEYITHLTSKKYKLSVIANETQRTVDIFINFDELKDNKSLREYSVTYTI